MNAKTAKVRVFVSIDYDGNWRVVRFGGDDDYTREQVGHRGGDAGYWLDVELPIPAPPPKATKKVLSISVIVTKE